MCTKPVELRLSPVLTVLKLLGLSKHGSARDVGRFGNSSARDIGRYGEHSSSRDVGRNVGLHNGSKVAEPAVRKIT